MPRSNNFYVSTNKQAIYHCTKNHLYNTDNVSTNVLLGKYSYCAPLDKCLAGCCDSIRMSLRIWPLALLSDTSLANRQNKNIWLNKTFSNTQNERCAMAFAEKKSQSFISFYQYIVQKIKSHIRWKILIISFKC